MGSVSRAVFFFFNIGCMIKLHERTCKIPEPRQHPRLAAGVGRSADTRTLVQCVLIGLHTRLCV